MINIELDLNKIKELGKRREKENFRFRTYLKGQDSKEIDKIAHRLNDEITKQIDCTKCGNCCYILRPYVSDREIEILSKIDNISITEFIEKFTEIDDIDKARYLRRMPCQYLKDKICTIYNDRPRDCKSYPHTQKTRFTSRTLGVIDNYEICPIVFNLYERLKEELNFR